MYALLNSKYKASEYFATVTVSSRSLFLAFNKPFEFISQLAVNEPRV